ncbi:3-oxoacyl-[acyl-carrier-protein] synthase 3 [Flavobacterium bizetiae]|uniref:3-oxoacyl-[acyl-carrier-protein] synthase 3 n=1 Tax=Flavobacterium bizetiae TaxID=2704140 RepID=A0A6J4GXK9_9FLAO|nr:ketoacyl-ACP synthase III [Flavobacterium bizetiae]CAA9202734.1 3-oxoacyl-[acyl-carrier-protein] synthase 3 [Flavobacterium bizetiae]CAD5344424.1 3-oxoacyl-[acyl-carrier-protein] synthase 3 [Flavobacterium bizetiae]CAD5350352.1 3-oxoacyl-[acyl-carrier-protein] synthase 3 [Flavobacterium bizetiae]
MKANIKAISYYLPEAVLSNDLINQEFPEWEIEKISSKTGINSRHISADNEFSSDMAVKAAEKLFAEHNIDRSTIDYLLFCTQSPDYFLPTTACIIQDKLGLNTSIGALDFNLGCSGFVYGLSLAKGLIAGEMAKNILLITAETYSKFIHPKDKSNKTIFGDAAAATLITAEKGFCSIGNFIFGTDGRGAENLIVKQGGMRFPVSSENEDIVDEFGNVRNDKNLYMNGAEIFNFTGEFVPKLIFSILEKSNLTKEDIDLFIFHQANKYMLNHLRKKIKIPEEKFFIAMEGCGNTVSSTIPIALYEAQKQRRLTASKNLILAGFGVGYSWAACNLII